MTRILFATDLHGNRRSYGRLFDHALATGAGAIVLGGDITPLPPHHGDRVAPQREFLTGFLHDLLRDYRSKSRDAQAWLLMGNDDWACNMDVLESMEREDLCRLLHLKAHPFLDDLWIAGYSCVPVTPFFMKDWDRYDAPGWEPRHHAHKALMSRDGAIVEGTLEADIRPRGTIEGDLARLEGMSDPSRTVYVCHTPPLDTKLDVLHDGTHIGSGALRDFLRRSRSPLSLHGHIHESPKMSGSISDRIGRTVGVNPGESLHELQAVTLDLKKPDDVDMI